MWFRGLGALGLLVTAGCSIDCFAIATGVFAGSQAGTFVVSVRDARTGVSLVSGSTLIVRGSAVSDSVTYESAPATMTSISLPGRSLPEGTYAVEVRRPGYQTWHYGGISLFAASCGGARPVYLTADLIPE